MRLQRGELVFTFDPATSCVKVWLGEPGEGESEFVTTIHESLIPDLVAGLRATLQHCRDSNR